MLPSSRRGRPIDVPSRHPISWSATFVGLLRRIRMAKPIGPSLRSCGRWPSADRVVPLPRNPRNPFR
jgi:hypothetical protein